MAAPETGPFGVPEWKMAAPVFIPATAINVRATTRNRALSMISILTGSVRMQIHTSGNIGGVLYVPE